MVERERETPPSEQDEGGPAGACGSTTRPDSTSPTGGHERRDSDGEMQASLQRSDVDAGERQRGVSGHQDETGDGSCLQEPSRQVLRYAGYWDLDLRIPQRSMPPPPKDTMDQTAMDKWHRHCWMLRNFFGSGN